MRGEGLQVLSGIALCLGKVYWEYKFITVVLGFSFYARLCLLCIVLHYDFICIKILMHLLFIECITLLILCY